MQKGQQSWKWYVGGKRRTGEAKAARAILAKVKEEPEAVKKAA